MTRNQCHGILADILINKLYCLAAKAGENHNELSLLFKTISKSIKKYGLRNLLNKIREIEEIGISGYSNEMLLMVIRQVCDHYKITHAKLLENKGNSGRFTPESEARKMCYVLIKKYIPNLSGESIAKYFNRNERVVFRAFSDFKSIYDKVSSGKELRASKQFYDRYMVFCVELDKAQLSLKDKYTN